MTPWVHLTSRSLIAISGPERIDFLQGLVTQKITGNEAVFSAILLPNGRFFTDFFVIHTKDFLVLDCAKEHAAALLKLLAPYGMLHDVALKDLSAQFTVCAALGARAISLHEQRSPQSSDLNQKSITFYTDPRHSEMGMRALVPYVLLHELPHPMLDPSPEWCYHKQRIARGIPEGAYDLIHQQSIILEYGYQHIHALDWTKGCYMGQELMARTFHRGNIRKHLYRMTLDTGHFPAKASVLYHGNGDNQGTRMGWMGSHHENHALATLHESLYDGAQTPMLLMSDDGPEPLLFSVFLEPVFNK